MQEHNWREYVIAFVDAYREEATQLSEQEKEVFKPCVMEETLEEPCQIEVIEFQDPFGVGWFFIRDENKRDLLFSIHRINWKNTQIIEKLNSKYPSLQIHNHLHQIFNQHRKCKDEDILYSLDARPNILAIFFPRDVRKEGIPKITTNSDPGEVAEAIFHLNHGQGSTYA